MLVLLAIGLLLALVFAPSWWVRRTLRVHGVNRADIRGTGAELARHLLDQAGLGDVVVEPTGPGQDHYDPLERAVRLSPDHFEGRSVAAVAVATHEVGHALQHRDGDPFLVTRTRIAASLARVNKIALVLLISIPLVMLVLKSPLVAGIQIGAVVALLGTQVLVHLLTLPIEIDASFRRALPILQQGQYLSEADMPAARSVLRAAAATYVASALATLLDVVRWIR